MKSQGCLVLVGGGFLLLIAGCGDRPLAEDAGPEQLVPLTPEFPELLYHSGRRPIQGLPNLVPALTAPPKVMVPSGTILLSQGKAVTSSDGLPIIGSLELVNDGDKDAGEGYYVELDEGLQWVQIDLERFARIGVVWIWRCHILKRAVHDVIVQVSDDPEFKTGVITLFNNDHDDSAGIGIGRDRPYVESRFGKPIDAKGARARYVRLYSSGSTYESGNRYIEVEVYGTPELPVCD